MPMKFSKEQLVGIVTTNREEHKDIFDEAVDGYKAKAIKELEAHIERIRRGDLVQVYVSFPKPVNHTRDYDRLLKMLALTTEDEVELTETQFSQYVLDDWDWKRQFLTANSAYSKKAFDSLSEDE